FLPFSLISLFNDNPNSPILHHSHFHTEVSMRSLVRDFLNQDLSRRGFLKSMAAAGFTVAAAESVLKNLVPLAHADTAGKEYWREFEGNGGAMLAEQLLQTGIDYLFVGNGSG